MEHKITLEARIVEAMKQFMAAKDIRYYLNGMLLELLPNETRLCATDGNMLAVWRGDAGLCEPAVTEPLQVIIPDSMLAMFKSASGVRIITVGEKVGDTPTSRAHHITVTDLGVEAHGKSHDALFPDYRRVIPAKISGVLAQFNPDYLTRAAKAFRALRISKKGPTFTPIAHNGNDSALLDIGDKSFCVVIMPQSMNRASLISAADVAWAAERPATPAALAQAA